MISGIGVSDGISIGKVFKYDQTKLLVLKRKIVDVNKEKELLTKSIKRSIEEIDLLREKTQKTMDAKTSSVFAAHIEILQDETLTEESFSLIESEHVNADFAFKTVSDSIIANFEKMGNEQFRERAIDIKDVSKRVLMHVQGVKAVSLDEIDEEVILIARDLTPSDTAQLDKNIVKGFVTDAGGRTSHTAIMAKILGIPAIVGTKNGFDALKNGYIIILDGFSGDVIVNPSEAEIEKYQQIAAKHGKNEEMWKTFKDKKTISEDDRQVEICANIGRPEDLNSVIENGAEGIGLFRTEFLYMGKSDFPKEEEQLASYKQVLEAMGDKPVVVRTLDIGGDKKLDYFQLDKEINPFLGNRALRLSMGMKDVFKTQLRALLRASVFGNLHIMFPMVATIDEFRDAKEFLKEVEKELISEGNAVSKSYKVGIMIEIPSAAILADIFAKEVDFFSIGSNDLIQYTFAADRMNEKVSYLYQTCNPSLLRLISMVIEAAHKEGKWVGLCGEMAGEISAIPLLLGLGLDEFSVSASQVLKVRHSISRINYKETKEMAEVALTLENQEEVLELIKEM